MRSNKKDNPLKVGRFGIGFNSVYHITDLPSIVSGDTVAFLDPHEKYFVRGEPGQAFSLKDPLLAANNDQFQPFHNVFNCNLKQGSNFQGTLFRFPLRTEPSELSTKLYTKTMVESLFDSFKNEASVILHFLKSVDCISLYERENRSGKVTRHVYTVKISDECLNEVLNKKKELTEDITSDWDFAVKSVFYTLEIEEQCNNGKGRAQKRKWFMANQVGTEDQQLISLGKKLQLLPWVGVSFPVDTKDHSAFSGRIFCFLPLPPNDDCRTGLPVQVNGYFGLTDNRRALKWPGPDCLNDDTARWNQLLMGTVGSSVYANLIENMIRSGSMILDPVSHVQLVYSALPRIRDVKQDWRSLLEPFCKKILKKHIFHTTSSGKAGWLNLDAAILDRLDEEACTSKEVKDVVLSTLLTSGQPVVTSLPRHVLEMVDNYSRKSDKKTIRKVTPRLLREVLRTTLQKHPRIISSMDTQKKLLLLDYVLQDTPENAVDLQGVPLVPLENGEFCAFQQFPCSSSSEGKIFVASEKHNVGLFPNAKHRLLRDNLPQSLKQKLIRLLGVVYLSSHPTQLFHLTRDDVKDLLWQNLPAEWSSTNRETVSWIPGKKSHPPVAWLPLLWKWIAEQYPENLSEFEGMPLIPVSIDSKILARLRRNSSVILAEYSLVCEPLPLPVRQLLMASSCIVVERLPSYLKHDEILDYVAPPTPERLLQVLYVARDQVRQQISATSDDAKLQLRSMLSKVSRISADHASFLLALPIFQAVDGKSFVACQVNNERLPVAASNFSLPVGIQIVDRRKLISSSNGESRLLLKRLGMNVETTGNLLMSRLQRYLTCSDYSEQEKNKLMFWILERMEILVAETPNFAVFLRQLAFVSTASGTRKAPCELFDHSDELLRRLLLDYQDAFPVKEFLGPMQKRSSDLGVRCRSNLTAQDLLRIINVHSSSRQNGLSKGKALLELINQRPNLLVNTALAGGLRKVAWLPRVLHRPDSYPEFVPWYDGGYVCKPEDMCPSSVALLVGASVPLFDERLVKKEVQDSLGICRNFKLSEVVEQLRRAIVSWNGQRNQPFGIHLVKFQDLLKKIYNVFSKTDPDHILQLLNAAQLSEWVWQGSGFTSPNNVALLARFPKSISLHPHLFLLPKYFLPLKGFLRSCGVKEEFTDNDLLSVLWSIRARHLGNGKQNAQVVMQDLDLCRAILEWIVRDGKTLSEDARDNLLVPVDTPTCELRLELCSACTYCDREFLRQGGSESLVTTDSRLIHKAIPDQLASSLGVPSLSSCLVGATPLGYEIEEAGQYEPITTRLRNILQQYKEGVAIFKEIIQNADDAKASKVCFVVDWRESPRKRLLSDELANCQGPALWAYNNAMFSKQDFENINKLAGETKKDDLEKVGRFGLGFNAVYHITDVPSFISGEHFVVLDPNMNHIAKVIGRGSRPGMKINLATSKNVLSLFPDQFLPYNDLFGCNTRTTEPGAFHFEGTLFRFPFRTHKQARQSEISQDPYTRDNVDHVLESLKESSSTLLLFAQNIKHVRVFEIPRHSDPKKALGEPIISISKEVEQIVHSNHVDGDVKGTFLRKCCNWMANERNNNHEPTAEGPRRTELLTMSVSLKESKVSNKSEPVKKQVAWLVNSFCGSGSSFQVAESENGRKHGVLPITGAAVKVSHDRHVLELAHDAKIQSVAGEVFCFMPLSISSGLPIHINGYFSVYSNRRRLWEEGVGEQKAFKPFEALWNEALMEDALVQVYLQLLEVIKSHAGKQYVFHSLWPNPTAVNNTKAWKPFVVSFFNKIIDEEWPLIYCNKEWRALRDCLILDPKLMKASECVSIMTILGENVLPIPEDIMDAFRSSGKTTFITQHTLTEERFLRDYFFPNVTRLPCELRDTVLCRVLDRRLSKLRNYDDLLKKYPSFSCSKDGKVLRKPTELVHPRGEVACLFSRKEKRFPVDNRCLTKERSVMLEDLGMIVDHLSWDGLCERAEWISSRFDRDRDRAANLVRYLNRYLNRDLESSTYLTTEQKERLASSRFLPFLEKPRKYTFPWKASTLPSNHLVAANVLYPEHFKVLVGATQLILNESSKDFGAMNKTLKGILGLSSKQPQLSDVVTQLDHVIKGSDSLVAEQMEETCSSMYSFFQRITTLEKHNSQRMHLRTELERRSWMLVKGQMINPKCVAKKWDKPDGSPYLFSLTDAYKTRYHGLITWYGVKEKFTLDDFLQAIRKLREDTGDMKLSNQQLTVLITFLSEVCEVTNKDSTTDIKKSLPLPDSDGVLHDAAELAMNDAPWIQTDGSIQYVHTKIPKLLAYSCGAKELRSAVLSNCSEPIGKPFGQSEQLTDRLNGILKSYPPDEGILKELVQNADDAKAKEIHFVFDPRAHARKRVFSDQWAQLQGPAICVYNDQPFTKEDIKGIQNLGIGSKTEDAEKTGQYGIGFNAVYHLTDCPSFLSDDKVMCVSDPHRYYVPGATLQAPGRLFNHLDDKFRGNFRDVLRGFLGEFFTLKGGTMFRLPLRQSDGFSSAISQKTWSKTEIRELLQSFQDSANQMLLFLNNVTKISISEVKNGKLETYSVQCTVSNNDKRSEFSEKIKQYKKTPTSKIPWYAIHYTMSISDTKNVKQDWLVCQSLGSNCLPSDGSAIPDGSTMGLLPRAGVAARLPSRDIGYASVSKCRAFCFLPLPVTTNLPVHVNGHFALDPARRNLWQDPNNCDVRTLWNAFVNRQIVAPAYASLICEARGVIKGICHTSALRGFFASEKKAEVGLRWYHDLFPDIEGVDEIWKYLGEALYKEWLPKFPVLPVAQSVPKRKKKSIVDFLKKPTPQLDRSVQVGWSNVAEVFFCPGDTHDTWSLEKSMLDVGIPLLSHTPKKIHAGFKVGGNAKEITPAGVTDFLRTRSPIKDQLPQNIKQTALFDYKNVFTLTEYCSKDESFFNNLEGVPLLLTQDETLRCFSAHAPVFCSRFNKLVPSNQELFLHEKTRALFTNVRQYSGIIKEFDIPSLSKFKDALFPSSWTVSAAHQPWDPSAKCDIMTPSKEWLNLLWEFIHVVYVKSKKSSCLESIATWPIIPTTQNCLVPVSMSKTVLNVNNILSPDSNVDRTRRISLIKLGCPQLQWNMPTGAKAVLKHYLALIQSPKDVLHLIDHTLSKKFNQRQTKLNDIEVETLLMFLQTDRSSLSKHLLLKLPFFQTIAGSYTNLSSGRTVYEVPSGLPMEDLEVLSDIANCVFLRQAPKLRDLYEYIGIQQASSVHFYMSIVLKHFNHLTPVARESHLKYIRDYLIPVLPPKEHEYIQLISALKKLPFIPGLSGTRLRCAFEFYDPENKVFAAFLPNEKFPPQPFDSEDWKTFLHIVGLQSVTTKEHIQEYAMQIQQKASKPEFIAQDKNISKMAEVLVLDLFERTPLHDPKFLLEISKIKFVPAAKIKKSFLDIHPAYEAQFESFKSKFNQFRGSVSSQHAPLVWSSAHLLLNSLTPTGELANMLGIHTRPPHELVIVHAKNISVHFHQMNDIQVSPNLRSAFRGVMEKLYNYFKNCCHECSPGLGCSQECLTACSALRDVPFVLVDEHTLVCGSQLSFHGVPKSMEPHMFEVPRNLGQYEHLLKRLGAQELPTPLQYATVLQAVAYNLQSSKDKKMHPGEKCTAYDAMLGLFLTLQRVSRPVQERGAIMYDESQSLVNVTVLYLPTEDNYLKPSTQLVVNDTMEQKERLKEHWENLLVDLITMDHEPLDKMVELLPPHLKVQKLSCKVHEELSPACISKVCVMDGDATWGACEFIRRYRRILCSSEFSHALIRLYKFQENVPKAPKDVQKNFKIMETCLTISCMQAIETRLVLTTTGAATPGSEKEVNCFFSQNDHDRFRILIKHGEGENNVGVLHERLSSFIHKITGRRINEANWRFLMMILGVKEPSQISRVLDEARVPRTVCNTWKEQCPGETIPEHFHFLLKSDIDYYLRKGELVGYELVEEDERNGVDPVYVYAKIIEQTCEGVGKYRFDSRYKINIGKEEPIEASKLKLYKFEREGTKKKKTEKGALSTEIVPYEGDKSEDTAENERTPSKPNTFKEARKEVAEALKEIWNLPESERSRAIKRLIRRWHPDKNKDCESLANEVTKFLLNEVDRLKKGGVPGYTPPDSQHPDRQHNHSASSGSRSTWDDGPDFSEFFQSYQRRARRQRERYDEWRDSSEENTSEAEPANKNEGERWMRQARQDFDAARYLFESRNWNFYAFTCFHCQQAVEKCLKAVLFVKGHIEKGDHDRHEVMSLAYRVSREDESLLRLPQLAKDIQGYYTNTRYPEHKPYFVQERIPSEMFTEEVADDALSKTREILHLIGDVLKK